MAKVLYGLNKSGGLKVWSIWTEGNKLYIEHGKEGGKMQVKCEDILGKNIGRSNETSPEQQAILEAESRYKKQLDKGYRESKEDLEELPILPMLAHDYLKQGHRIKYPCLGSPKLDGVRCLAIRTLEGVQLKSRGGKFYNVPHIQENLMSIMKESDILDGELYKHGWPLEDIVSATKKISNKTKELEYIVFDKVTEETFQERMKNLLPLVTTESTQYIRALQYLKINDEYEMKMSHKQFVKLGYEGIMLRNLEGLYESGKRSADLQKYKEFLDEEFEIIRVTKDRNDNAVFVVYDKLSGKDFTVTYGDFSQRKQQLENPQEYIGKMLTVKYQTRYKGSLLPQFPTGVIIRDYEE